MPIPDFNHNHVLPPYLGSPTDPTEISPYECEITELCERFATSEERVTILKKLIHFRTRIAEFGIESGFQWLNGSFMQNIEVSESRAPNDIDVVTFYEGSDPNLDNKLIEEFPEFVYPDQAKKEYSIDHYIVDYGNLEKTAIINVTHYWSQLFTHTRGDIRKGIVLIKINTPDKDLDALKILNSKTL